MREAIEKHREERRGSSRPRAMLFCQYVRGIGHLVRTGELARELARAFDTTVISGGTPVPGMPVDVQVAWKQIPPIHLDENSGTLVPSESDVSLSRCQEMRRLQLTALARAIVPDVVVTEHFPFGLLFEEDFEGLVETIRTVNPRAKVVASVRDVVLARGGRVTDPRTCELLEKWFDLILVHGDESIIRFDESFPSIVNVRVPLLYTGYVVKELGPRTGAGGNASPLVVASVGGGRVGGRLLVSVIGASGMLRSQMDHSLKVFCGPFLPDEHRTHLRDMAAAMPHVEIVEHLLAFRPALASASLSIGLAGYNTLIESVAAGVPTCAYLHGFDHGDQEQRVRAERFENHGLIEILEERDLAVGLLADRIMRAMRRTDRPPLPLRVDGARNARRCLEALVNA